MANASRGEHRTLSQLINSGVAGLTPALLKCLPQPWYLAAESGAGYDIGESLLRAIQAALLLRQPLLLTGDPGVGKTRCASALAERLGLNSDDQLQRINVKTTTTGRDLLYSFDDVARFRDATLGRIESADGGKRAIKPLAKYVNFNGLGRAILRSAGPSYPVTPQGVTMAEVAGPDHVSQTTVSLGELFPIEFSKRTEPDHTIVLIDEMDKAPRDAPNDLLVEIEEMRFHIRELGIEVQANPQFWPIVLITSNSERSFPDPFLRRCVFHHIEFPDEQRLVQIVVNRISSLGRPSQDQLTPTSPMLKDAVARFRRIRGSGLDKAPGTAELIAFVAAAIELGKSATRALDLSKDEAAQLAGIIGKTRRDEEKVRELLAQ